MDTTYVLPLGTILLLGAFHGINPRMGWLFAVALGMQERRVGAVWRALIPLTIGHGLAIAAVVLIALAAGIALPAASLKLPVARDSDICAVGAAGHAEEVVGICQGLRSLSLA